MAVPPRPLLPLTGALCLALLGGCHTLLPFVGAAAGADDAARADQRGPSLDAPRTDEQAAPGDAAGERQLRDSLALKDAGGAPDLAPVKAVSLEADGPAVVGSLTAPPSWSHTSSAAACPPASCLLVVTVVLLGATDPPVVKCNGVPMTTTTPVVGGGNLVQFWYTLSPAATSALEVVGPPTVKTILASSSTWRGVDLSKVKAFYVHGLSQTGVSVSSDWDPAPAGGVDLEAVVTTGAAAPLCTAGNGLWAIAVAGGAVASSYAPSSGGKATCAWSFGASVTFAVDDFLLYPAP